MRKLRYLGFLVFTGAVPVAACSSSNSTTPPGGDGTNAGQGGQPSTAGASAASPSGGQSGSNATAGTAGTPDVGGAGGTNGGSAGAAGGARPAGSSGAAGNATCDNTSGAAFPPITSYTGKDGGFGPAVITRNTGDASLGTDANGMANKVAIFRPAAAKYGQGGVRHPLLVWGNGHTNTVDIWQGFLARVATYGFVVVAPEQTEVTADHMNKALDYVLSLANDLTSGDCGKIDATKLGSTGYSLGGIGAISVGSNARISSTFVFASNGNIKALKGPWGVVGGDMDMTFTWSTISAAVTGSTQPAFGAALAGIDHNGVAAQSKSQQAYIGWMRWRFMGDQAGHDMFVGPNCQLCSDTAFSAFVKTVGFDSL